MAAKFTTTLKSIIGSPLRLALYLYTISLTTSIAGMEIGAVVTTLLIVLYFFIDRFQHKREVEYHTIGVELPLLIFISTVAIGLKVNAPDANFWDAFGSIRNLLLIYIFAFALQAVKNLNRIFLILIVTASLVAIYAIWQHFTGIDLIRHSHRALALTPWAGQKYYASVGFFSHHLTYSHSFMMLLCVPWAALVLARRRPSWQIALIFLSFSLISVSLLCTYARGVWIAVAVTLPIMAFFASRKVFFVTLLAMGIIGGGIWNFDASMRERAETIWADNYHSNEVRKQLWHANVEMFEDHPWLGVGYKQNEPLSDEYYRRMGVVDGMAGHAHSNYVELLATTGIIGFSSYMLLILAFILMTARLYSTIPTTHYWHRVFALAAIGAQLTFHIGGLTQWNFGDGEVQHQFIFWLAIVAYMSQKYYAHIVPDDQSL